MLNALECLPEDPAELRAVSELLMVGVQSLTYQDEKLRPSCMATARHGLAPDQRAWINWLLIFRKMKRSRRQRTSRRTKLAPTALMSMRRTNPPGASTTATPCQIIWIGRMRCCHRVRTALTAVGACARSARTLPRNWNMYRAALWYAGSSAPAWPAPVVRRSHKFHCPRVLLSVVAPDSAFSPMC